MSANVGEAPRGAKDSGNTAVYRVGPTAWRSRVEGRMEQGIARAPRTKPPSGCAALALGLSSHSELTAALAERMRAWAQGGAAP